MRGSRIRRPGVSVRAWIQARMMPKTPATNVAPVETMRVLPMERKMRGDTTNSV